MDMVDDSGYVVMLMVKVDGCVVILFRTPLVM
jgi:hypothetical protein